MLQYYYQGRNSPKSLVNISS